MKKDKLTIYILEIVLIILLITAFIPNFPLNTRGALACFILIYSLIVKKYVKKVSSVSIRKKNVTRLMLLLAILYIVLYYVLGLYTGYSKSVIIFGFNAFIKYILPISVTIIASEKIRKYILPFDNKLSRVLLFIIEVIIDMLIYSTNYYLGTIDSYLIAIGYVLFGSIASNLLFNYICKRYEDKPVIIYRLITVLYAYLLPYIPSVYVFFKSFCRMIYPALVYYVLDSYYGKSKSSLQRASSMFEKVCYIILATIITIFIMLISCKFKYGALVIGSASMKRTLDIGDVVIFEKTDQFMVGDIIVFNKGGEFVVHRIVTIKQINNHYQIYTKGDANTNVDNWILKDNEITGVVRYSVPKIGTPTIMLKNMFKK